jgi:hypothetical protein
MALLTELARRAGASERSRVYHAETATDNGPLTTDN